MLREKEHKLVYRCCWLEDEIFTSGAGCAFIFLARILDFFNGRGHGSHGGQWSRNVGRGHGRVVLRMSIHRVVIRVDGE